MLLCFCFQNLIRELYVSIIFHMLCCVLCFPLRYVSGFENKRILKSPEMISSEGKVLRKSIKEEKSEIKSETEREGGR